MTRRGQYNTKETLNSRTSVLHISPPFSPCPPLMLLFSSTSSFIFLDACFWLLLHPCMIMHTHKASDTHTHTHAQKCNNLNDTPAQLWATMRVIRKEWNAFHFSLMIFIDWFCLFVPCLDEVNFDGEKNRTFPVWSHEHVCGLSPVLVALSDSGLGVFFFFLFFLKKICPQVIKAIINHGCSRALVRDCSRKDKKKRKIHNLYCVGIFVQH